MWNDPRYELRRPLHVTRYTLQAGTFSVGFFLCFLACNLEQSFVCNVQRGL